MSGPVAVEVCARRGAGDFTGAGGFSAVRSCSNQEGRRAGVHVQSHQPGPPAGDQADVSQRVTLPPLADLRLVGGGVLEPFARARVLARASTRPRIDAGAAAVWVGMVEREDGP